MAEHEIEYFFSNAPDRNTVRMRVVNLFAQEEAGLGRGDAASRYTYYVESASDGRRVHLRRPANLHNGFDFVVYVEGVNFNLGGRYRGNPSHDDIIADLRAKKEECAEKYDSFFELLERVYLCEDVDLNEARNIDFDNSLPCDLILATVKWLFIEQDIRYWNYSGRAMLWEGITAI